jgi:hypothetical protein
MTRIYSHNEAFLEEQAAFQAGLKMAEKSRNRLGWAGLSL